MVIQQEENQQSKTPTTPSVPEYITPQTRQDELLDKLTLLLDVEELLPNSIRTTVKDITKILIAVTIIRKKEDEDNPVTPTEPEITPVPDTNPETHIDIDYTDPNSNHTISIDNIFPKKTDIEIVDNSNISLSDMIAGSYTEDTLGLKEDYVSTMYLIIQRYIQEMLCAANNAAMSYENLLYHYDGDAVKVPHKNLKHLHDTIIRNQIAIDEEAREFSKTHSADNTLTIIRSLETAYQQKKKYYSENYR